MDENRHLNSTSKAIIETHEAGGVLQPQGNKHSNKKCQRAKPCFSYISRISLAEEIPMEEELHSEQPISGQDKPMSLQILMEEQCSKMASRCISVQWDSFVKIKKRNYLEDYLFVKQVGKGAYGSVLKVKMRYGGLFRAAKIVDSTSLKKEGNKEKFFAEIAIPIKLDHPNISKLYEVFQWKNKYALIMEICQGGDLFSNISRRKFYHETHAAGIMKQLMSAVYYMHRLNVMHRDLKLENILLDTETGNIKIIDFGTATYFTKDKKLNKMAGTPYYLAPQMQKREYDEKCDVWSCGVIMYILLTGSPPFNGNTENEIMENICTQKIDFNSRLWKKRSKECRELLQQMLTKDPKNRPSAEDIINSTWITKSHSDSNGSEQTMDIGEEIVKNLKTFHFQNKLKAVVYTYIASQLYSNKDKEKLLVAFRSIDKDGNGVIQKDELLSILQKHPQNNLDVERILSLVDTNQSGRIDFTEFLVAASNEKSLLEKGRLENAFGYLDADHSGFITIEEVKAFLDGTDETANQIKAIFQEVDANGDGQISKTEFVALLTKH